RESCAASLPLSTSVGGGGDPPRRVHVQSERRSPSSAQRLRSGPRARLRRPLALGERLTSHHGGSPAKRCSAAPPGCHAREHAGRPATSSAGMETIPESAVSRKARNVLRKNTSTCRT